MLSNICGYIIDIEGVFFKDNHLLPGGKELINILTNRNIPFVFLTNLNTKTPQELHEMLTRQGIYVKKNQIISSATLVRDYLKENYPTSSIKVYGTAALKSIIYDVYRVGTIDSDIIVVGMDPSICLNDLSKIREYINEDKKLIFTNPDYYSPKINGYVFNCGLIVELFKPHLKEEPFIIGKPSKFAFDKAIEKLNMPRDFIAMIGDTYETDIKGAHNAGIIPIHLQTTNDDNYHRSKLDAYEYKDLEDFCNHLRDSF